MQAEAAARHQTAASPWRSGRVVNRAAIAVLTCILTLRCGGGGESQGDAVGADTGAACQSDLDCAPLNDGNACNGRVRCLPSTGGGRCVLDPATFVVCDTSADTACMTHACDPDTGDCAQRPRPEGTACDDGDPCSVGDRCVGGACKPGTANACGCKSDDDCADREDGDLCNGTLRCDKHTLPWVCAVDPATVVSCPESDPACQTTTCDGATGKCGSVPHPDGQACDDDDPCTAGDSCASGTCVPGQSACTCTSQADCAVQEDGDLCNGVLYCDTTAGQCKVNPATVVSCPKADAGPCQAVQCQPTTGACALLPVAPGTGCDDGDGCTTGDLCVGGACKGGQNTCTCVKDADCADKDDGDLCNGVLFCNKASGQCAFNPASVVVCPSVDDTACAKNVCLPKSGKCAVTARSLVKQVCAQAPDASCAWQLKAIGDASDPGPHACDDGDICTQGDVCQGQACASGAMVCTCKSDADCLAQDDGDLCNGVPYCDKSANPPVCQDNPASVVKCDKIADTACLKNACKPKTGKCALSAVDNGAACDDGDKCSKDDLCQFGKCAPGTDICECHTHADCAGKDDGDLCNGTWYCDKSGAMPKCAENPASVVFCPKQDDGPCAKATCDPKTGVCGLKPLTDGAGCDDGDKCTAGDTCQGGACVGGAGVCACAVDADCLKKDDGDLCNGVPYCDKSGAMPACKPNPASVVFCPKGGDTQCVKNTCAPKTGQCHLKPLPDGTACEDGDKCTAATVCAAGACAGKETACDDGDPCTLDGCLPGKGCVHEAKSCDDGNSCTEDGCDAKTGQCLQDKPVADGQACNADGDGCTVNDACLGGVCKAGSKVVCSDKTGVCQAAQCLAKSATAWQCVVVSKPDGVTCDDPKSCYTGAVCAAGACQPGVTPKLYTIVGSPGAASWWRAVQERPGGGLVLAGGRAPGQTTKITHTVWVVMATDPLAKPLWTYVDAGQGQDPRQEAVDVHAATDGTFFAAGQVLAQDGSLDLQLVRLDGAGKALWKSQYEYKAEPLPNQPGKTGAYDASLARMIVREGEGIVLAGTSRDGEQRGFFAVRVDVQGSEVWKALYPNGQTEATGAVWTQAGRVLMVGRRQVSASSQAMAWRALNDDSGKPASSYMESDAGQSVGMGDGVELADGRVLVGVWRDSAGKVSAAVRQLDGNGVALRDVPLTKGGMLPESLVRLPDGRVALAGRTATAPPDIFVGLTDKLGNLLWTRTVGGAGHDAGHDVAPLSDGGLAFVGGRTNADGVERAWLLRAGPWGHGSCAAAGLCKDKVLQDCDDGKICTADTCDPVAGCKHEKRDANYCEAGDGCADASSCHDGQCQPAHWGKNSTNFTDLVVGPAAGVNGLTQQGKGAIRTLFATGGQLYRYEGSPEQYVKQPSEVGEGVRIRRLSNEDLLVTGWSPLGPTGRVAVFARHQANLKPLWAHRVPGPLPCPTCETGGRDATEVPGGGLRLLLWDSAAGGTPRVVAVTAQGAPLWHTSVGQAGRDDDGVALAALDDASVAVAGRVAQLGKPGQGMLLRLSESGRMLWSRALAAGQDGRLEAVAQTASRAIVAAGWRMPNGTVHQRWLLACDLKGDTLWEQTPVTADLSRGMALVAEPHGGVVVAGHTLQGGVERVFLGGYDGQGQPLWDQVETALPAPQGMRVSRGALMRLQAGGYAVGVSHGKGQQTGTLRVMPWGFTSCQYAGACKAKQAADCDDGNPCTADVCEPLKGCVHLPATGAACGKDGHCLSGQCAPGACGDGKVQTPWELCDGAQLAGATCAQALGQGHTGQPTCAGTCTAFETAACQAPAGTTSKPADSCQALSQPGQAPGPSTAVLDPDGPGPITATTALCDQPGGWRLVHDAVFDQGSHGWQSPGALTKCGPWGQLLGGHQVAGAGAVLARKLSNLPPHKEVRVGFRLLSIDTWDNERARLSLDGAQVWQSAALLLSEGANLCGGPAADREVSATTVTAHDKGTLLLQFTSTLDQDPADESLGLARVVVWVR